MPSEDSAQEATAHEGHRGLAGWRIVGGERSNHKMGHSEMVALTGVITCSKDAISFHVGDRQFLNVNDLFRVDFSAWFGFRSP